MTTFAVLATGMKLINLALHLYVTGLVLRQFLVMNQPSRHQQCLGFVLLFLLCVLLFRIDDVWMDMHYWRMLMAFPMTVFLFVATRIYVRIMKDVTHTSTP